MGVRITLGLRIFAAGATMLGENAALAWAIADNWTKHGLNISIQRFFSERNVVIE